MAATGSIEFSDRQIHLLIVALRTSMTEDVRDDHMRMIRLLTEERDRRNNFRYANKQS